MRDVVLIPCYERPEFTRLCLQYLSRARGIENKEVWLCQDNHGGKQAEILMAMFPVADLGSRLFPGRFRHVEHAEHSSYGNSQNLVDSLKRAHEANTDRVYLVEDDILVAPDFFSWHEAVLEEPDVFVSCSTALSKSAHFQINGPQAMDETYQDPAAYYLAEGPYSSHAVAFKRENLEPLVKYLCCTDWGWQSGWEQDILTQKYLQIEHKKSAWPFMPRAYNIGWYSYHINTGRHFTGTLAQQSAAIERVIKDSYALRDVSANNNAVTPLPEHWPVRLDPVRNVQRLR